jgi:hypothetical protein
VRMLVHRRFVLTTVLHAEYRSLSDLISTSNPDTTNIIVVAAAGSIHTFYRT